MTVVRRVPAEICRLIRRCAKRSAPRRVRSNGGFGLEMWAAVVNRDGVVCAVAFSGGNRGDQWPGSRVISAQKANTANAFSLPGLALSTANLYSAVQPGGSLFGLQASNPVDTDVAYGGNASNFGRTNDPMVGGRIGGVNVFGGGLALYAASGRLVGAIGVSGDSSCADHNIAWRTRNTLGLDYVPGRRERRPGASRQHRLRHHAASRPDARRQRRRLGPSRVQRRRNGDRGHAACGEAVTPGFTRGFTLHCPRALHRRARRERRGIRIGFPKDLCVLSGLRGERLLDSLRPFVRRRPLRSPAGRVRRREPSA